MTASMTAPPPHLLSTFNLRDPVPVAETPAARIWRVQCAPSGRSAALKHYKAGHMGNEAAGYEYLARCTSGAAKLYAVTPDAALLEWLDGPSLGDCARDGDDKGAAQTLALVAKTLLYGASPPGPDWPRLDAWFTRLLSAPATHPDIARAQTLAQHLLETQPPVQALHGDLHHENVRQSGTDWRAFDAKGLAGDPAYELANAFRHPKGIVTHDPARIDRIAAIFAETLGVDRQRLLQWAAAKAALSIVWSGRAAHAHPDGPLLRALLESTTAS